MDAKEYQQRADACLAQVADWLESFDPDEVDYSTTDGVVTIEFPDRVRYVLNRQAAASQMWFAAGARAWHYDHKDGEWRCDKDDHELNGRISEAVSEKLGRTVSL